MKIPLSWLKEYVKVDSTDLKSLMWRMTEIGLTCETYEKIDGEIVLDVEVTPNRPDWMSVVGIAREIAAISNTKLTLNPPIVKRTKIKNPLEIKIKPNYDIVPRITSVLIRHVSVKPSPQWLQKRIKQVGLRPINNLVDITNYVLWTYGSLLHAFDYDKIRGHQMTIELSLGGEPFRSLDSIDYKLPKNAIIIKDAERIIDLIPFKGGENTASYAETKNVLLHSIICDPIITRRISQKLNLRSDSSAIAERGLDPNGTTIAVNHALSLILELAGGEIASDIIDHKPKEFIPRQLKLNLEKLGKVLGIIIPTTEVIDILAKLNLSPKLAKGDITCLIPTYRGDLKIEEDLIEEVARIYGYNKFPKTLPKGTQAKEVLPYYNDHSFEFMLKDLMAAAGYTETQTLSLVSEKLILNCQLQLDNHLKLVNPVSSEYQYLRTSLIPNLLAAVNLNSQVKDINLFEVNKTYFGPLDKSIEPYKLTIVTNTPNYATAKGILDLILTKLNIGNVELKATVFDKGMWHPTNSGVIEKGKDMLGTIGEIHPKVLQNMTINQKLLAIELDVKTLQTYAEPKIFKPIPKNPPQIEDITINIPQKIEVGKVVAAIKAVDKLIDSVDLMDVYKRNHTFRIYYQHPTKTLTDEEIKAIRSTIGKKLKEIYQIKLI